MTANFHIPDIWKHYSLNLTLIDTIKEHPEYFYDDIHIASCYGCFPPALWNGGRAVSGFVPVSMIKAIIKAFNDRNVPIRYTFTNPTLTEKDLSNSFCNSLCRYADNGFNEIIVNVPCLEKYIRKNFPNYPLISSTVKQIEDYDQLMREFDKDYKLVVLDYNWNNDFEKLEKIPKELRSRCEILINPYCVPHCQRRGEHYRVLGESQRAASKAPDPITQMTRSANKNTNPLDPAFAFPCPNPNYNFYQITQYKTFISREAIFDKYLEMGFNNFKIEGRVLKEVNVVESYAYYLVKPEYRDKVRLNLLTAQPVKLERKRPERLFIDYDGKEIPQKDE